MALTQKAYADTPEETYFELNERVVSSAWGIKPA